ncbi:transposase IS3/IS911 family protein, partial [Alcaligenes faecalis subsp. faecalis NCIB 8687]
MSKNNKFSPEVRERAVRLVQGHRDEYRSLWAAVESIAPKIGCTPTTLLQKLALRLGFTLRTVPLIAVWEACGARVMLMDPATHDEVLASV